MTIIIMIATMIGMDLQAAGRVQQQGGPPPDQVISATTIFNAQPSTKPSPQHKFKALMANRPTPDFQRQLPIIYSNMFTHR